MLFIFRNLFNSTKTFRQTRRILVHKQENDFQETVEKNLKKDFKTSNLARNILEICFFSFRKGEENLEWNLKNAVLFGFGILTTLGN